MFDTLNIAWLAKSSFEWSCLSLFVICCVHSYSIHGLTRTLREFSAGFFLTAAAETTGVLSGAYVYPGFQFYVMATPVANPASWVALIYILMTLSDRIIFGHQALDQSVNLLKSSSRLGWVILSLAICDATLALLFDLVLDPLATIYNWWIWVPDLPQIHTINSGVVNPYNFEHHVWMETPSNPIADFFGYFFPHGHRYPTRVMGIPAINFIAWFVFVFIFSIQFRWIEQSRWSELKKTAMLWAIVIVDVPILSFCLIAPNI